ncbi:MAG: molybdate ABC transporter substrate-binding protein [Acidobacteria bacterium]|nr:MAG: molybdate ABC transporter substrate-binding protein [Acidobacteriota bacterium]
MRRVLPLLPALMTMACGSRATPPAREEINVATAANLTRVFAELGQVFEHETGIHLVTSFGATTQLAQQIAHGAPYDVFAAADNEHVDQLARKGLIFEDTRAIYARGKLVLWVPDSRTPVGRLEDLARANVTHIAVANPQLAPYGRAAVETLHALHLWEAVEPRIVFAQNISMATQYAATGNADTAFTALALVYDRAGRKIEVPAHLHAPIDQAIAVLRSSSKPEQARKFVAFIAGPQARGFFKKYGYE